MVRCVLEIRCGWVGVVSVLQASAEACNTDTDTDIVGYVVWYLGVGRL